MLQDRGVQEIGPDLAPLLTIPSATKGPWLSRIYLIVPLTLFAIGIYGLVRTVTLIVRLQPLPAAGVRLEEVELNLIRQALERHDGNRTHAARSLGLTRQTLLYRMRKLGLR